MIIYVQQPTVLFDFFHHLRLNWVKIEQSAREHQPILMRFALLIHGKSISIVYFQGMMQMQYGYIIDENGCTASDTAKSIASSLSEFNS